MTGNGYTKVWELAPREILRLDGARGTTLRVTRGTLWLTLEDDPRDIVLGTGDSFTVDRGGLTVLEAQSDATVCALASYVDATRIAPRRPDIGARVAALFGSVGAADFERRWVPYF
jgi:hypothetical protein